MKRLCSLLLLVAAALPGCARTKPAAAPSQGLMTMEGALANRYLRADKPGTVVARLRIATHAPEAVRSGAVNVVLVMDTSGSMEGQPITDARAAALAMVDTLADGDHLAVVAFGSRVDVLLPATELDADNRTRARKSLEAMKAEGTTDLAGGLRQGLAQAQKYLDPHGVNRIVLVGDGVPNDESAIRPLASQAASQAIPITVLGLGPDYNETLMGAVAQLSGGQFHYVRESVEVASFFKSEVLRLKQVYARNAGVDVTPGPGVHIDSVVGLPMSRDGNGGVHIALGDISRTDTRDLVVRVSTDPHREGASVELFDAVLTFDDAWSEGERVERRVFLGAKATASDADLAKGKNTDVEDTAATMQAAATTVQAIEMVRNGDSERARAVLDQAAEQADNDTTGSNRDVQRSNARKMRALSGSLPAPSPVVVMPGSLSRRPSPPKSALPAAVREAHDDAMQHLQ
ncbi:MAG: vWA domain-containing protein [Byssovorax sp.]